MFSISKFWIIFKGCDIFLFVKHNVNTWCGILDTTNTKRIISHTHRCPKPILRKQYLRQEKVIMQHVYHRNNNCTVSLWGTHTKSDCSLLLFCNTSCRPYLVTCGIIRLRIFSMCYSSLIRLFSIIRDTNQPYKAFRNWPTIEQILSRRFFL